MLVLSFFKWHLVWFYYIKQWHQYIFKFWVNGQVLFQEFIFLIFCENSLRTISDRSIHLKHSPVRHLVKCGCITEGCIAFTVQVMSSKSMPHKTFTQRRFTEWKYLHSFSTETNPPPDPLRESIHGCRASKSLCFNRGLWEQVCDREVCVIYGGSETV